MEESYALAMAHFYFYLYEETQNDDFYQDHVMQIYEAYNISDPVSGKIDFLALAAKFIPQGASRDPANESGFNRARKLTEESEFTQQLSEKAEKQILENLDLAEQIKEGQMPEEGVHSSNFRPTIQMFYGNRLPPFTTKDYLAETTKKYFGEIYNSEHGRLTFDDMQRTQGACPPPDAISVDLNLYQRVPYHVQLPFNDVNLLIKHGTGSGKSFTLSIMCSVFARFGYTVMVSARDETVVNIYNHSILNGGDFNVQEITRGGCPRQFYLEKHPEDNKEEGKKGDQTLEQKIYRYYYNRLKTEMLIDWHKTGEKYEISFMQISNNLEKKWVFYREGLKYNYENDNNDRAKYEELMHAKDLATPPCWKDNKGSVQLETKQGKQSYKIQGLRTLCLDPLCMYFLAIDESHNILKPPQGSKYYGFHVYYMIYQCLRYSRSRSRKYAMRIVLSTATPGVESPVDIINHLNLLQTEFPHMDGPENATNPKDLDVMDDHLYIVAWYFYKFWFTPNSKYANHYKELVEELRLRIVESELLRTAIESVLEKGFPRDLNGPNNKFVFKAVDKNEDANAMNMFKGGKGKTKKTAVPSDAGKYDSINDAVYKFQNNVYRVLKTVHFASEDKDKKIIINPRFQRMVSTSVSSINVETNPHYFGVPQQILGKIFEWDRDGIDRLMIKELTKRSTPLEYFKKFLLLHDDFTNSRTGAFRKEDQVKYLKRAVNHDSGDFQKKLPLYHSLMTQIQEDAQQGKTRISVYLDVAGSRQVRADSHLAVTNVLLYWLNHYKVNFNAWNKTNTAFQEWKVWNLHEHNQRSRVPYAEYQKEKDAKNKNIIVVLPWTKTPPKGVNLTQFLKKIP